jgi:transcriptional regulator with XRE-family HTH domain
MRLGELIGVARECKGWSLRELEKHSGVSNALISQIETNKIKDPGFSTVIALAEALGLGWDRVVKCGRRLNPRDVLRADNGPYECETCRDDPMTCASIPGLHHCAKAQREAGTS